MNSERTVLLVGDKPVTIEIAKSYGLDVILFQHKKRVLPESARLADALIVADYTDWAVLRPLVLAAQEAWGFHAALSLAETGLVAAGLINDLCELPGTGFEVSHRLRNKWMMRQHLATLESPGVAAALATGTDALISFGDRHGYPFIVKPTELSAGFGVLRVAGPRDVSRVWNDIVKLRQDGVSRGPGLFSIDDFIMEEYIDGSEYSVEAFSFNSRHVIVAVTEKLVQDGIFVELGHALPARIDAPADLLIRDAVTAFLDDIGLRDGPSHTEIKLSGCGPRIIESHNRVGGDKIKDLVRAAYGIDLAEYAVGWPFGLVRELADRPEPRCAAATRFLYQKTAGEVTEIRGVEQARACPDVLLAEVAVRPGDIVGPLRDNWDRLGQVAVTGPDTDAAVHMCERVTEGISIDQRPF